MRFGRNIKLVTVLEYKNQNFVVIKHAFTNNKHINLFNDEEYQFASIDNKDLRNGTLCYIPSKITELELKPWGIYTDNDLVTLAKSSNVEFGSIKVKKKNKVRR